MLVDVVDCLVYLVTTKPQPGPWPHSFVRVLLQTGLKSEMDAPSSKRTWLQRMCCALITPDVLIYRKEKERLSGKGENDRKRG
jgi:hypothetical protein